MAQSHREASRRLFEIDEQQQGFFTTKQAKAAGFAREYSSLSRAGWELDPPSVVTANPAIEGHLKTGHRAAART
jgi:hypothetical protein